MTVIGFDGQLPSDTIAPTLAHMSATRLFERAILRISPRDTGEDIFEFLQGLVTNEVTGELPVWAALLTPQ